MKYNPPLHDERYHSALNTLSVLGFDTSSLIEQHKRFTTAHEVRTPRDSEHRYTITTSEVDDMFLDKGNQNDFLRLDNLRLGWAYRLTKGQREVLRERYGLTPTTSVIITILDFYPSTRIVERFGMKSTEHVTELARRKHLLNAVVIEDFESFWEKSASVDAEAEQVTVEKVDKGTKERTAKAIVLASEF